MRHLHFSFREVFQFFNLGWAGVGVGVGRGVVIAACLSRLTIDHASLSRRRVVLSEDEVTAPRRRSNGQSRVYWWRECGMSVSGTGIE